MMHNDGNSELHDLRHLRSTFEHRVVFLEAEKRGIENIFAQKGFLLSQHREKIIHQLLGTEGHLSVDGIRDLNELRAADEYMRSDYARLNSIIKKMGGAPEQCKLPLSLWEEIKNDPRKTAGHKWVIAYRFFPEISAEFWKEEFPILVNVLAQQKTQVCKLYLPPCTPLYGEPDTLLKEAYNSIISDAFASYGFQQIKKQSGLVVLGKPLIANALIVVEIPWRELKDSVNQLHMWPQPNGGMVTLDGYRGKRINMLEVSVALLKNGKFKERQNFYGRSDALPEIFATTCSLEVVLRGFALWYELTILPFEQEIRQKLEDALTKVSGGETVTTAQPPGLPIVNTMQDSQESNLPSAHEYEPVPLLNYCAYALLRGPCPEALVEEREALPGVQRCFAAAADVTVLELAFEKVVGLLDPALILPRDELRDELVKLSHQQALLLVYYAEDHGWGWSLWDKGHRVCGFRQDIEESVTQQDGDLRALQRLGLKQAQVDQMLTAVQHICQADAQTEGWMDMSAHIKRFLGTIGVGVSP